MCSPQVTHSCNCFKLPAEFSLGYLVAVFNLIGSFLFAIASACYFVQVRLAHMQLPQAKATSPAPTAPHRPTFTLPRSHTPGLGFGLICLAGAMQVAPFDGRLMAGGVWGWEYQVSEWGVRFTYGLGSMCFIVAALISFPELLNE